VIIESPRHVASWLDLSVDQIATILRVYRDRVLYWASQERMQHTIVFKNSGLRGGASLEHVHSQLVALPFVPDMLQAELAGAAKHHESHGQCVYCRMVQEEMAEGTRLVAQDQSFVAFCAYAGRQPYETWILPKSHESRFEQLTDGDATSLAEVFLDLLDCLAQRLSLLAYNLILHTAPFSSASQEHYHWHWELIPQTTRLAGLEWGAGTYINPVSPEQAARSLRETRRRGRKD